MAVAYTPFTFLQILFETPMKFRWGGLLWKGWGLQGCGMGQLYGSSMSEAMEALLVRCSSPCCGPVLRGDGCLSSRWAVHGCSGGVRFVGPPHSATALCVLARRVWLPSPVLFACRRVARSHVWPCRFHAFTAHRKRSDLLHYLLQ
jgi:hypothetical protein